MLSRWIKPCFYGGLVCLIIGFLFPSGRDVLAFNGPHKLSPNECDVCHIPHHAADDMLWARATTGPFAGVKRLCASCHGQGLFGAKDYFNIFNEYGEDVTYDHVMGSDASINGPSIKRDDWAPFPLKEREGGDGFYCGSCHDPHLDPYEPIGDQGGGDYLRQETADIINDAQKKEMAFCTQCHEGIIFGDAYGHGNKKGCYDCHHPHASKNPGSKILISPLVLFTAIPNCRGFSDSEKNVSACYGCHKEGSGFDGAIGAPLAGDDISFQREHHPMGIGADASSSGHQPTQAGPLSPSGELYCGSCHTVHNGTNDHYLNPQIVLDFDPANSAFFCIACHSNKTVEDLGPRGKGHHQISLNNQCLFCHSIHNSPSDPDALYQTSEDEADQFNSSVSVDVIMRIAPENLAWSDKLLDTDTKDYEDACYGCHFRPDIVGREFSLNEENSLLLDNVRDRFFSHRFNAVPSAAIKVLNTFDDRLPIVSDGLESESINDYGVEKGRIWCGSCHNVHRQNQFPAESHEDYKERRSAYLRAENYGSALCYRCHTGYHEDLGRLNHPQDAGPNPPITSSSWERVYYQGYSGGKGGLTNGETRFDTAQGEVVCQTCHSVHTAETDWDGGSNEDDLLEHGKLIVKALDDGFCQDCHESAHGGASGECSTCHHPHSGIIIFVDQNTPFKALPNVPSISDSDDPEDPNFDLSSYFCYGCHQPHHLQNLGDHTFLKFGAAPIFGDYILREENTEEKRNHHPMGTEAKLTGGKFLRATGAEASKNLNKNQELTCISCHTSLHGLTDGKGYKQSKENNFLRWDFTNDNAGFCIKCHSDKLMGSNNDRKHFWDIDSPIKRTVFNPNSADQGYEKSVSCRQCMFCHFIHDGKERGNDEIDQEPIRADIDALMRINPNNLVWGDRSNDTDPYDYEDMCYGCHSDEDIVGGGCKSGALLKWSDDINTHRFASIPNNDNSPYQVILNTKDAPFPKSDGDGTNILNDYGTEEGHIFCGTCHNVHDNRVIPYLNHEQLDLNISPYEPEGFCEYCHNAVLPNSEEGSRFLDHSHPIGVPIPEDMRIPEEILLRDYYREIGCKGIKLSRSPGSEKLICLSCHNVHAAVTNWKGGISSDPDPNNDLHGKLLIIDNFPSDSNQGSDMCKICHPFDSE